MTVKPLQIMEEERDVLVPRDKLSVYEYAEQVRVLSGKAGSRFPGPWSTSFCPFQREPMEALSDMVTEEVHEQKCAQSGGSEVGMNFLGRIIEEDPASTILAMPKEDDGEKRVKRLIIPTFEVMPSLMKHLPNGKITDINITTPTVLDKMIWYMVWATSAAELADTPAKYEWLDEIGKWPAASGKEADPMNLLRDRMTTYQGVSKLYAPSTPVLKNDLANRCFNEGDQRQWWSVCVHCGYSLVLRFENIHLVKDSVGALLSENDYKIGGEECSWYFCPHCASKWTETERWAAVNVGIYAPRECTVENGKIVGKVFSNPKKSYHIPAFLLNPAIMKASIIASKWSAAKTAQKTGDIKPLQNVINSLFAEPFELREKVTESDVLQIHIGSKETGIVPDGVQILTAALDVQIDHLWIAVVGWGYLSESWLIMVQRLETGDTQILANWQEAHEYLAMDFVSASDPDKKLSIRKAGGDCGYRGEVMQDFCQQSPMDIVPLRGSDKVRTRMYSKVPIAGGTMDRYDLNVNSYKDRVYRKLFENQVSGPGYMHLPSDISDEILDHLTSEEMVKIKVRGKEQNLWQKKDGHRQNHTWDLIVYNEFVGEIAGARALKDPNKRTQKRQRRVGKNQRFNNK